MPSEHQARPPIDQQIVFIRSRDFGRATRFYEEVLDLPLVLDQGACRIYRVAGDAYLGVCRAQPDQTSATGGVIMTFVTNAVSEWYERLLAGTIPTRQDMEILTSCRVNLHDVSVALKAVFQNIVLEYSPHRAADIRHVELGHILSRCVMHDDLIARNQR